MKTERVLLIGALMLVGFVASVAPTLAASHSSTHPAGTNRKERRTQSKY